MKGILFICVENRARSQMAEGLARHFLGHDWDVLSAGSRPAARVHPMAIAVMAEIGIDISKHRPKSIDEIDLKQIDLVVSLCSEEECPVLPAPIKRLDWSLTDPSSGAAHHPAGEISKFRKTRDEIRRRVLELRSANQLW